MALADYYARTAVAAAQVLNGFDDEKIRSSLLSAQVGISIGHDATKCAEGLALLDLLIRLLARFYPILVIRGQGAETAVDHARQLAEAINPKIEFGSRPSVEIAIGGELPVAPDCLRIFAGSAGWTALVGTGEPRPVGCTNNPFGPGAAACIAAANVFRSVFLQAEDRLDRDCVFMTAQKRLQDEELLGSLGEILLVGAGAIGNGAAWALSRAPMSGLLHIVDHQTVDLGNLQRYVMAERSDEGTVKVEVLQRYFSGKVQVKPYASTLQAFLTENGYSWPSMLLALDTSRDRRAAQASLPNWVANAWTQPGDLGVSTHDFLNGACVSCLYLPDHALQNEDLLVAQALGIPDRLIEIRGLLHTGGGVPRLMLEAISTARAIPIDRLLPFENLPIRSLYVEGFCGGAVIPLNQIGSPHQDVHVPLAPQSALAGILLAATVVQHKLQMKQEGSLITRIDLLRPLGSDLTQPITKDPHNICICQDEDFRNAYLKKYSS
jgi:hypothetical protein